MRLFLTASRIAPRARFVTGLVDQPEFQGRRRRQYLVQLVGVLHARQLHDDTVNALPLYQGFGNAELVNAIAQRCEVLLDGEILSILDLRFGHAHGQRLAVGTVRDDDVRVRPLDNAARSRHVFTTGQPDRNQLIVEVDAMTNPRTPQPIFEVLLIKRQAALDRRVHIDFKQDIHAAAKIETKTHRCQTQSHAPIPAAAALTSGRHWPHADTDCADARPLWSGLRRIQSG